jgi:hypothetical protein
MQVLKLLTPAEAKERAEAFLKAHPPIKHYTPSKAKEMAASHLKAHLARYEGKTTCPYYESLSYDLAGKRVFTPLTAAQWEEDTFAVWEHDWTGSTKSCYSSFAVVCGDTPCELPYAAFYIAFSGRDARWSLLDLEWPDTPLATGKGEAGVAVWGLYALTQGYGWLPSTSTIRMKKEKGEKIIVL